MSSKISLKKGSATVLFGLAIACISPLVQAAVITPVSVTASSEFSGRPAVDVINGAGLDPTPGDVLAKNHNQTPTSANGGGMWMSDNTQPIGTQYIIFDLGDTYTLNALHVWNYAERNLGGFDGSVRGIHQADLYVDVVNPVPATLVETFTFAQAPNLTPTTFQGPNPTDGGADYNISGVTYSLTNPVVARYVMLDIASNYGSNAVGLSEIRFVGELVPEPSAFFLASFAACAFVVIRRKCSRAS